MAIRSRDKIVDAAIAKHPDFMHTLAALCVMSDKVKKSARQEDSKPNTPNKKVRDGKIELHNHLSKGNRGPEINKHRHPPLFIPLKRGHDTLLTNHLGWLKRSWNIDLNLITDVAFYAWSAIDLTEILQELAQCCPNLQSITIGYTTTSFATGFTPEVLQSLLWFGVDYPSAARSNAHATPDLDFFTRILAKGQEGIKPYLLDPNVIPLDDQIMHPWYSNDEDTLSFMKSFFHGRKCPTIRVVGVPLVSSETLPNVEQVGNKLRFLSPVTPWAAESFFAKRKRSEKSLNSSPSRNDDPRTADDEESDLYRVD